MGTSLGGPVIKDSIAGGAGGAGSIPGWGIRSGMSHDVAKNF